MTREATYVYGEQERIDYAPGGTVADGEVVCLSDDLIGIATEALAANVLASLATAGVFDVAKAATTGTAFILGEQVFFDESANVAVNANTSDKFLGYCVLAAADSATTVRVKLARQAATLA
jgi:predicted RecA/RadA family phage recombinase